MRIPAAAARVLSPDVADRIAAPVAPWARRRSSGVLHGTRLVAAPCREAAFHALLPTNFGDRTLASSPAIATRPTRELETFDNPRPERDYEIRFECPEFTCLCPKTGQPDFATLRIRYVPDRTCVELKSLKLYLWSFRNEGHFHEDVTNRILDDLVAAVRPRTMEVVGDFLIRGGIHTVVTATHAGRK